MTEKKHNEKEEEEKKSQEKEEKENYSFLYFLKLPPTGFAGSTGTVPWKATAALWVEM